MGLLDIITKGKIAKNVLVGLVYHEVSNHPSKMSFDTRTFTSVAVFEKQMKWVSKASTVVDPGKLQGKHKKGSLILSFDDGYKSFKHNAYPIIKKLEFPVICFINSATINKQINSSALVSFKSKSPHYKIPWEHSNPVHYNKQIKLLNNHEIITIKIYQGEYLSWEDIYEIGTNPLVSFGNHLQNHWYSPYLTEKQLRESIKLNEVESLHVAKLVKVLAWPHGVSTKKACNAASAAGIKIQMFGMNSVLVNEDTKAILRVDMNQTVSNYPIFRGSLLLARLKT